MFRIKESTMLVPSQALLSKRSLHSSEVTHLCVSGLKCLNSSCGMAGYCRVKVCPQGPDLKGPVSKYSNTLRYWCRSLGRYHFASNRVCKKISLAWCLTQPLPPWALGLRSKGLRECTGNRGVIAFVVRQPHQTTENPQGD